MSPRRVAGLALGLALIQTLGAHAALQTLAAETGWVSTLLSPGSHSQLAALVLGASFLAARLSALVVVPAVVAGFLGYLLGYVVAGAFCPRPRSP